jgi:hypothetical protein
MHDLKINLVLYHSRPSELIIINLLKNPVRRAEKIRSMFIAGLYKMPINDRYEFCEDTIKVFKFTVVFDGGQPDELRFIKAYYSIPEAGRKDWIRQRLTASIAPDQVWPTENIRSATNLNYESLRETGSPRPDSSFGIPSNLKENTQVILKHLPNSDPVEMSKVTVDFDLTAFEEVTGSNPTEASEAEKDDLSSLKGLFS